MNVFPVKNLRKNSPVWTVCQGLMREWIEEYGIRNGVIQIPKSKLNLLTKSGLVVEFNGNDFLNPSSFRGFTKYYKCNTDTPKYWKRYFGRKIGVCHAVGFKLTDYDSSKNILILSNPAFLGIMQDKRREEFVNIDKDGNIQSYPAHLYLGDDDVPYDYQYDREWEYIRGLNPQEKIVLANAHNEEPFPNSLYENDKGMFSKRVRELQLTQYLNYEINDYFNIVDKINEIESDNEDMTLNDIQNELDKEFKEYQEQNDLIREDFFSNVNEGFDYGSWEMSDLYTRTPTQIEDFELYPVRVNCQPKSIRKKGKSPYDTKLGVREWRYVNHFQKPKKLQNWITKKSPKYNWEREELDVEYDLPENFWEEIEMAYQDR